MTREGYPAHGGNLEWASERYGLAAEEFIDFSSNVNPLGPPPRALEAARAAVNEAARYPEPNAAKLKSALARHLAMDEESLVLGNGSSELIHLLVRCVAGPSVHRGEAARGGSGVTVVAPAFGEYERAARIAGVEPNFYLLLPRQGFSLRPASLAEEAARSRLTFLCNPASPTGMFYPREELLPTLEACRETGGILAVDESFMDFVPPGEAEEATMLGLAGEEGLVVFSTLTKAFALAGLRGPGWLAGPAGLASRLEGAAVPWRVNVAAQAAALASLEEEAYLEETRAAVAAWREELAQGISSTGFFEVFPSRVNFLLLRLSREGIGAGELVDALGKRGILVRDCADFRGLGNGYLRVAVRRPEENRRFLEALEDAAREVSLG